MAESVGPITKSANIKDVLNGNLFVIKKALVIFDSNVLDSIDEEILKQIIVWGYGDDRLGVLLCEEERLLLLEELSNYGGCYVCDPAFLQIAKGFEYEMCQMQIPKPKPFTADP